MSNLIISNEYVKFLPFSLAVELKQMPDEAQYEYMQEMNNYTRSSILMYLIHFLSPIPFSLGYVGKWLEQFLFWITFGGLGIWWIILLFTIPKEIRNFNRKVAMEVYKDIALKYGYHKQRKSSFSKPIITPKQLNLPEFDPTLPTLDHLKEGFLFDLDGKTWQIIEEYQFDSEHSERVFICQHDLEEKILRYSKNGLFRKVTWSKVVNVFQIDPELEKKIRINQGPANILYLNGHRFYKENQHQGVEFKMNIPTPSDTANNIKMWHFFNEHRDVKLDLISSNKNIKAYQGRTIDENEIIDILPYHV